MRTIVDLKLREEARRYLLRFSCADCVHFEKITGTCAEGFPNDEHVTDDLDALDVVVFCKEFELS